MIHVDIDNIVTYMLGVAGKSEEAYLSLTDALNAAPPWREAIFSWNPARKITVISSSDKTSSGWYSAFKVVTDHGHIGTSFVNINDDGRPVDMAHWVPTNSCFTWFNSIGKAHIIEEDYGASAVYSAIVFPVMIAITFCHMKNVTVEKVEETAKQRKRREHKGEGRKSVIMIGPAKARIASRPGSPMEQISQEIRSMVRGHFKTYTDDDPLFGKQTGTFWWAPQARSDREQFPRRLAEDRRRSEARR